MIKEEYTVISLFAGAGGSSLGYHLSGGNVLGAVEQDKHAVQCYHLNFPDTHIFQTDIQQLSTKTIMNTLDLEPGQLDLLDGSPPCQGFSVLGKCQSTDPRNQLYHEYIRILRELQPKTFVFENVPGLTSQNMKPILQNILNDLKTCGYQITANILNAMYYNCPTNRRRLIIIGARNDLQKKPTPPPPETTPIPVIKAIKHLENQPYTPTKRDQRSKYLKLGQYSDQTNGYPTNALKDYKINPYKPAPTITGCVALYHYNQPRLLRNNEYSTIQTFTYQKNKYTWTGPPSNIKQRIANSVPPNLTKAISNHTKKTILQT